MTVSQTKGMVRQALDRLIVGLEAGQSHQLKAYLSAMARFHAYSLGNVFLIRSQFPQASRVAGFCTWQSMGRYVRRGEHGIRILVPIVYGDGERQMDRERSVVFRTGYVFDISQTDGRPLPEFSRVVGDPGRYLGRLRDMLASRGIGLEYLDTPAGVHGWSEGGRVVIRRGLTAAEEFSVMVHELAHELLHRGDDNRESRSVRETEAEAVAFVVGEAIGLDGNTAATDYIRLYDGNRETLLASLDRIHRTAAEILGDLGLNEQAGEPLSIIVQRPAA